MEASDEKRMKEEEENIRLKRIYANLVIDNEILQYLFTKKAVPCLQMQLSAELLNERTIPVSRA